MYHRIFSSRAYCAGLLLCAASTALTSPAAADADTDTLDPIVVTASRQAVPVSELSVPVVVIDRAQIERSLADDLGQLLRFVAGVDIGRNGGPGQTTSTFIRGAESNHTLVLVDGVRINPGTLGLPAIQNLRPELIERVEIVKGNRSSLYGADAIGGVINVITRSDGTAVRELGVGGGRYGARDLVGRVAGGNGATTWQLGAALTDVDGFPARRGAAVDSGHDNLNVNAGVSHRAGDTTFSARLMHASGNTEYLDFLGDPKDQDFTNAVAALGIENVISERWTSRVDLSLSRDDIQQNQSLDVADTQRLSLDWQNTLSLVDHHTFIAGVYAFSEDTESLVFGTGFDEDTNVAALYVGDNYARGAHRASIAARYTDHDAFGSNATWHADYTYLINDRWAVHGASGRAFRAPDATDRFGFGGNTELEAETSRTLEAAVSFRPDARQSLRLGLFDLAIDDLIIFDFDPITFAGQNRNIAEARIQGIEASYSWRADTWGLQATAVVQDPSNEETDGVLPRRARRSLTVNAWRAFGATEVGLDVLMSGERKDSDFSDTVNAGYVLANLSARTPLPGGFEIRAKIENLLDANYETAAGFATPGRGLFVDLYYRGR
ncbi:MAG: TonB-dependent receptor [Pseudomonadota bacterium]